MASHAKVSADSPTKAPADPDDKQEQSLTRYATVVGIVTGLFGMSLGVGLILLPSATILERVLVIGACLAVSVAGLTGVGAWRSPRKFGLTMLASGLAIACLADLSITAAEKALATSHPIAGPRSRPSAAISSVLATSPPGATHSTTPTPTPTSDSAPSKAPAILPESPSPSPTAVFLSNLTGNPSQVAHAPVPGHWTLDGKNYSQSLGYLPPTCTSPNSITYNLDGKSYGYFLAEVGVADGWASVDQTTEIGFTVNGKIGSGSFQSLGSVSAAAGGNPTLLDIAIPPGTEELQLVATMSDGCMAHSTSVWGNARLTG
jgi:NPCBM/NEW2 domain